MGDIADQLINDGIDAPAAHNAGDCDNWCQYREAPQPRKRKMTPPKKQAKGFAVMDPAKVRELARRGGQAAHAAGTAHEWTRATASAAGRKGGLAASAGRDMSALGRKGGKARGANLREDAALQQVNDSVNA